MSGNSLIDGEVLAAYGRQYLVDCGEAGLLPCVPRGKKSSCACGDRVSIRRIGPAQGVIENIAARQTVFLRSSGHRSKLVAANATQVAIVCATEPSFSDELVARILVAAADQNMRALIILNKSDLSDALPGALDRLAPFANAGYAVSVISAMEDIAPVRPLLAGELTVLVGQSGMGKSTLVNALVPEANRATREISAFLASGRHATTHARLFRLAEFALIDCPGLQEFGLAHLSSADIERGFPELRPYLGKCRFSDCRHKGEPGCAVHAACENGHIHPRRAQLLQRILEAGRTV